MAKEQSTIIPLSQLRAQMARPKGMKKIDALISTDDPEAAVAALSIPDMFFLVQDVGISDALPLIALASGEQLQGCIDMCAWEGDRLQATALMPWIAATMDAGYECLGRFVKALDAEVIANFFAKTTQILDHSLGESIRDDDDRQYLTTVDTFFDVIFLTEDEEETKLIIQMIDYMYRDDMVAIRHILMSARSEMLSHLEEMSYRWRTGRMADLGYVDHVDALIAFRPIDIDSIQIGEGSEKTFLVPAAENDPSALRELPEILLEPIAGKKLLSAAMNAIVDSAEHENIASSLMVVINHVLSAAKVPPGDPEATRMGAEHAAANISLGLETLSRGDTHLATKALQTISLMKLHRLGFTLTLKVSRLARMIRPKMSILSMLDKEVVSAASLRHPFFPVLLDVPAKEGVRPYESLSDIARVAKHLGLVGIKISLAEEMGLDVSAAAEEESIDINMDDFLRTGLSKALLGEDISSSPLSADALESLRQVIQKTSFEECQRQIQESVNSRFGESIFGVVELAEDWSKSLYQPVYDMMSGITDARVDPKFLTGLIVVSGNRS